MIIKFKVGEYYDICEKYEHLFEQDDRGVMRVTPKGRRDLRTFSHHVQSELLVMLCKKHVFMV